MKKTLICLLLCSSILVAAVNAKQSESEEYIVKDKDTLWDISDSKLIDPFLWPKLWNVNPHIENPDLIYPGSKIRIPSREELMRMPAMPLKKKPARIKRRTKTIIKPVKKAPPEYVVNKNLFITSGWISSVYMPIGEVTYAPEKREIAGREDTVYLKFNKGAGSDKRFFTARDVKIVKHPVTDKIMGHLIRITGIVEITGMDNNLPRAKIVTSYEDINLGDGLLPFKELEPPLVSDRVRTPDYDGVVIESYGNNFLSGKGDIIFLDKGEKDGLAVGDTFTVLSDLPAQSSAGKIQVVSLESSTSGAVILESSNEITIGSVWGQKK
jgi:hypothetical protein